MFLEKKQIRTFVIVAAIFVIGIGITLFQIHQSDLAMEPLPEIENQVTTDASPTGQLKALTVHVSGAVKHPGVYTVPGNSRRYAVVQMAGGLRHDADTNEFNLAKALKDGEQLKVPSRHVSMQQPTPGGGLVSINHASASVLQSLPGVGPSTAKRIIAHRQGNGRFRQIEDLRKVKGIGSKTLEKMRPYLTL